MERVCSPHFLYILPTLSCLFLHTRLGRTALRRKEKLVSDSWSMCALHFQSLHPVDIHVPREDQLSCIYRRSLYTFSFSCTLRWQIALLQVFSCVILHEKRYPVFCFFFSRFVHGIAFGDSSIYPLFVLLCRYGLPNERKDLCVLAASTKIFARTLMIIIP